MLKKIITLTICTYIVILPLCIFNFSFADEEIETPPSGYQQVLTDQQKVAAWKAYCASRNNKTIASFIDTNTPFSLYEKYIYQKLQECANEANVDLDQLSANIYYNISNNNILSFWYSTSTLNTLNQLFNIWLNKNNQDVDSPDYNTPNTENVYSGVTFETYDGDSCLVYIIDNTSLNQGGLAKTKILYAGTPLISSYELQEEKETGDSHILINVTNNSIWEKNVQTQPMVSNTSETLLTFTANSVNNNSCLQVYPLDTASSYDVIRSQVAIIYFSQSQTFYIGTLSFNRDRIFRVDLNSFYITNMMNFTPSTTPTNADINNTQGEYNNVTNYDQSMIITTTNNSITNFNNNYEGDVTTKNGGPKITINTGVVNNIPIDIQLPNLDDIIPDPISNIPHGFSIPGLRYKFPFCIPFDLIAVYEVLDTTPEAPYFETEINFASFDYDLVIDLEDYNPYMIHIRNYFLILYIFGLLFITPKLLKA